MDRIKDYAGNLVFEDHSKIVLVKRGKVRKVIPLFRLEKGRAFMLMDRVRNPYMATGDKKQLLAFNELALQLLERLNILGIYIKLNNKNYIVPVKEIRKRGSEIRYKDITLPIEIAINRETLERFVDARTKRRK